MLRFYAFWTELVCVCVCVCDMCVSQAMHSERILLFEPENSKLRKAGVGAYGNIMVRVHTHTHTHTRARMNEAHTHTHTLHKLHPMVRMARGFTVLCVCMYVCVRVCVCVCRSASSVVTTT